MGEKKKQGKREIKEDMEKRSEQKKKKIECKREENE